MKHGQDISAPCRVWCPTQIRVSVQHRHNTPYYVLYFEHYKYLCVYVCVVSSVRVGVSMLHTSYQISPLSTITSITGESPKLM